MVADGIDAEQGDQRPGQNRLGGSEGELLDANPPAEPFGAPASTRLGSGLARWGTRDELVREEKRYRFSEARMEPSTFDTHNCDASRRGASLPRRTWPTSDPVDRFVAALRRGARR